MVWAWETRVMPLSMGVGRLRLSVLTCSLRLRCCCASSNRDPALIFQYPGGGAGAAHQQRAAGLGVDKQCLKALVKVVADIVAMLHGPYPAAQAGQGSAVGWGQGAGHAGLQQVQSAREAGDVLDPEIDAGCRTGGQHFVEVTQQAEAGDVRAGMDAARLLRLELEEPIKTRVLAGA